MQSYSLCAATPPRSRLRQPALHERKHNPFISYKDVQSKPARVANIVDFSQFATVLANNTTVPNYVWISPDQCHDMHGRTGSGAPNNRCEFFANTAA